jgi:hypothetical protein
VISNKKTIGGKIKKERKKRKEEVKNCKIKRNETPKMTKEKSRENTK